MWFWWFMFFSNLLIPVILIISGRMMWRHCPREINGVLGYRTKRSMQNMDTWKFAHKYCGQLWWKLGWVMLVLSVVMQIPLIHSSEHTLGIAGTIICTVQCVVLIGSIFPTESALKKTFKEDGTRR